MADEPFVVRAINANFRLGGNTGARTLGDYAQRADATPAMRAEALKQLGLWSEAPQRDRIVGIYRPLMQHAVPAATEAITAAAPALLGKAPEEVQLAALDAIAQTRGQGARAGAHGDRGECRGVRAGARGRAQGARCAGR